MRSTLLLILFLAVAPVSARMYQWVDPDTSTTQLSGTPPPWYRSGQPGPQVFVFEHGRVIDDTSIPVSESERVRLRQEAYIRAEQDRQQVLEKMREAQRMKAALDRGEDAAPEIPADIPPADAAPRMQPEAEAARAAGPTIEEMRALIEQWERARTEGARQLIEEAPAP
jgi:hypothetical protein